MGEDWAHDMADEVQAAIFALYKRPCIGGEFIVAALRKARADALEEAAAMLESQIDPFGDNPADYDTCAMLVRDMKDNPECG